MARTRHAWSPVFKLLKHQKVTTLIVFSISLFLRVACVCATWMMQHFLHYTTGVVSETIKLQPPCEKGSTQVVCT
jgi:hypothetical protein